jgi:methyltransferase family protein
MQTNRPDPLRRKLIAIAISSGLALAAALSLSQAQPATNYQPSIGQEGKDVIWLPTADTLVDAMLGLANLTPSDYLIDLGSGDGRTVIAAATRGIKALGVEYNPDMVELSRRNAAKAGVADKASFVEGDVFQTDFSKATVLTLFLLPALNVRLRPAILDMAPGVRVVSNSFGMGDWEPETRITVSEGCSSYCDALLWIVPAKLQGRWTMPQGELALTQEYQKLSGTLKVGNVSAPIKDGKITGPQIAFSAGNTTYQGVVRGDSIDGVGKSAAGETKWQATRAK